MGYDVKRILEKAGCTDVEWPIVTLCGSSMFYNEFIGIEQDLTLHGVLVFKPAFFHHTKDHDNLHKLYGDHVNEVLASVQDIHFAKIRKSDFILVVNIGGYYGDATKAEIAHAVEHNIPVVYLEENPKGGTVVPYPDGNRREVTVFDAVSTDM